MFALRVSTLQQLVVRRHARTSVRAMTFAAALFHFIPLNTSAEDVQFRMTGEITIISVTGTLPEGIYEGAPFEVLLSYDTETPEHPLYVDDPQRALYRAEVGADHFLRFRAGPAEISANYLSLWVGNDVEAPPPGQRPIPPRDLPGDSFQMRTSTITANFPIARTNQIGFRWANPSGDAFNSNALPTQLDVETFRDTWFQVFATSTSRHPTADRFHFRAAVNDIVRVPEPSTCRILLGLTVVLAPGIVLRLRNPKVSTQP